MQTQLFCKSQYNVDFMLKLFFFFFFHFDETYMANDCTKMMSVYIYKATKAGVVIITGCYSLPYITPSGVAGLVFGMWLSHFLVTLTCFSK